MKKCSSRGMLKSRCCVLLGDLRVLLLGPPTPLLPPLQTPMSGHAVPSHDNGGPDNNNTLTRSQRHSVDAAELSAALRGCSSSSDDCSKGKLEERFSLTSYTESGFRTPVCRICFQGPEHVCTHPSLFLT